MPTKKTVTTTAVTLSEQVIPVKISFDPLAVDKAKTDAIEQLTDLQGATIDNDQELQEFAALLVATTAERKLIEGMRDAALAPIKSALKAATATVDALFNPSLQAKEASERLLRQLVGGYQAEKAAEHRRL